MKKYFKGKIGEPLAILCARYWYRGIVSSVGEDYVVLHTVHAVEETGRATGERATTEDAVPSDVIISFGAMEIACLPTWALHNFSEKEKKEKKEKKHE